VASVIVTENLVLMPQRPAPLTIAPSAGFCFTLGALRGQRNDLKAGGEMARSELAGHSQFSEIVMPCTEYKWMVDEKSSAVSVDRETGCVCGMELGESNVMVQDQTLDSNQQGSDVVVATPGTVRLHLSHITGGAALVPQRAMTRRGISARQLTPPVYEEGAVAHVLLNNGYEMNAFLFSDMKEEMLVTDNTKFEFKTDSSFLHVEDAKHHYLSIDALKPGLTYINATLTTIAPIEACHTLGNYTPASKVYTSLAISIDKPLEIIPSCPIRLPYDAESVPHTFNIKAAEGSGKYRWHSESPSPAVAVTTAGLLSVDRLGPQGGDGLALSDVLIPENRASCQVISSQPDEIRLSATKVAVAVGASLTLFSHVTNKMQTGGYHNCSRLPITWGVNDDAVFSSASIAQTSQELSGDTWPMGACTSLTLEAMRPGVTTVVAGYGEHQSTIEITAFMPLEVSIPASRKLLVALGSTSPLQFTGGPSGGVDTVTAEMPGKVGLTQLKGSGAAFSWEVICLELHTQKLTLGITHPEKPGMLFTATVEYKCSLPASMGLQPTYEACPPSGIAAAQSSRRILNRGTIEVRLLAYDGEGELFDDMDSIKLGWEARSTLKKQKGVSNWSPPTTRGPKCRNPTREVKVHKRGGTILLGALPGKMVWKWKGLTHEKPMPEGVYVKSSNRWGMLNGAIPRSSSAKLMPYIRALRRKARAYRKFSVQSSRVGAILELMLLPHIAIRPSSLSVFRHPANQVSLAVSGGSGTMKVSLSDRSLAEWSVDHTERRVNLIPKENGRFKVTVEDPGLYGSEPVHSEILVSDISKVKLDVPQQLSLSSTVKAKLRVFASDGTEFSRNQLKHMSFENEFDEKRLKSSKATPLGELTVTGMVSGPAFIRITATGMEGTASKSDKQPVHVFPKLQLMPRHLHLLLGGEFQFQPFGGPATGYRAHFTISNSTVASMHQAEGLTHALTLGHATVKLVEYALNSDMILASDTAKLTVMTLDKHSELKISSPSSKLLVGKKMSVFLTGPKGESPFMYSFGMEKSFKWEVSDPSILTLVDNEGSHVPKSDGSYGIRLEGIKPGKATVTVEVEWAAPCCHGATCSSKPCTRHAVLLKAKATVMVVPSLELISPATVVVPRNTRYLIKTNKDASNLIFEPTSKGILQVGADGIVTTGDIINSCHVVVRTASGDQSLSVTFHVRTITQLMLRMPSTQHQHSDARALAMPLGGSSEVDILVQDEYGLAFTAIRDYDDPEAHMAIQYLRDRVNVVNVNVQPNGMKLGVSAMHQGMVAIRVWLRDSPQIDDYLRILVDNIIEPGTAQVAIGGTVQYTVSMKNNSKLYPIMPETENSWSSSNAGIATVHPKTGLASVAASGTTHIHVDGTVKSYVQLTGVRLSSVSFVKMAGANGNGGGMVRNYDGKVYRSEIDVLDKNGQGLFPLKETGIDHKLKIDCSVPISEAMWAEVWSEWDQESRRHVCAIRPLLPHVGSEDDIRFIQELPLHLTVSDVGGLDVMRANTSLIFMHAFRLSHHGASARAPDKIKLKLVMGESEVIDIFGHAAHVVASSNDATVVSVKPLGIGIGGVPSFEVRRTGRKPKQVVVQIAFLCRVTGQREVAEVIMLDSSHWSWDQFWYVMLAHLEQGWAQVNTLIAGGIIVVAMYFLATGGQSHNVVQDYTPRSARRHTDQRQAKSDSLLNPGIGSPVRAVPDGQHHGDYYGGDQRSPVFAGSTPGLGFDRGGRATVSTPRRYDIY